MSLLKTTPPPPTSKPKESLASMAFDYLEILVFSVCIVLLLFTFGGRLCRVSGSSMCNTLHDGETLITTSLVKPEIGDIVVFYQISDRYIRFNEPLVKRIIATEGQTVRIDYRKGELYIDGVLQEDPNGYLLDRRGQETGQWTLAPAYDFDPTTGIFETTVPRGCCFVMGDNRNNSADSRSNEVGFVDTRRMLGKVICRIKPWTVYE